MEEDAKGLMQGFVRGDRGAFEQIIRLYGDSLFGYLVKMSGDRETAEDYFQETIGRVCEKATSFRGGNLRAWIFRIATNVAMDGFRKEKKRAMLGLTQIQDCDGANEVAVADSKDISSPSEDAQRQEQKEMVQRIIEELPADRAESRKCQSIQKYLKERETTFG